MPYIVQKKLTKKALQKLADQMQGLEPRWLRRDSVWKNIHEVEVQTLRQAEMLVEEIQKDKDWKARIVDKEMM